MSDAGVIWLRGEDRFQQRCALKLVGVGLVSGGSRNVECDRVRDLSFVIVGIARRYLLFRCEIFLDARAMIYFVIVDLHRGDRVDVVPLALCLSSERLAFFDGFKTERKALRRRRRMRIVQIA